jgi:hypothetical protein
MWRVIQSGRGETAGLKQLAAAAPWPCGGKHHRIPFPPRRIIPFTAAWPRFGLLHCCLPHSRPSGLNLSNGSATFFEPARRSHCPAVHMAADLSCLMIGYARKDRLSFDRESFILAVNTFSIETQYLSQRHNSKNEPDVQGCQADSWCQVLSTPGPVHIAHSSAEPRREAIHAHNLASVLLIPHQIFPARRLA